MDTGTVHWSADRPIARNAACRQNSRMNGTLLPPSRPSERGPLLVETYCAAEGSQGIRRFHRRLGLDNSWAVTATCRLLGTHSPQWSFLPALAWASRAARRPLASSSALPLLQKCVK
jgi:hypothetical protein